MESQGGRGLADRERRTDCGSRQGGLGLDPTAARRRANAMPPGRTPLRQPPNDPASSGPRGLRLDRAPGISHQRFGAALDREIDMGRPWSSRGLRGAFSWSATSRGISIPSTSASGLRSRIPGGRASSAKEATTSARGTPRLSRSSPYRRRPTVPASTSLSPTTQRIGCFDDNALRIFSPTVSSPRQPRPANPPPSWSARTSDPYSSWRSATGITVTWTGASQKGNAPA